MGTELECYQQLPELREDNFYFKKNFLVSVVALVAFLTMNLFSIRDINHHKFKKYAAAEDRLIVLTAIQFQSQTAVLLHSITNSAQHVLLDSSLPGFLKYFLSISKNI